MKSISAIHPAITENTENHSSLNNLWENTLVKCAPQRLIIEVLFITTCFVKYKKIYTTASIREYSNKLEECPLLGLQSRQYQFDNCVYSIRRFVKCVDHLIHLSKAISSKLVHESTKHIRPKKNFLYLDFSPWYYICKTCNSPVNSSTHLQYTISVYVYVQSDWHYSNV